MKQVLIIFFIFISITKLIAQNNVEIKLSEASVIFSIGPQPAISSEFVNVSQKELMKAFEKYMKNYKAKTKSLKRETIATGAQIKTISTGLINVYCAYKQEIRGNKITAYFAFDLGNGFVSSESNPIEYQAARQFVYDFSFKFYRDLYEQKVRNANKDLKKLLLYDEKLKKEKKKLEHTIAKKKDEIKRAELLLNKNARDQELNLKAIEEQKLFIQKIEEERRAIK